MKAEDVRVGMRVWYHLDHVRKLSATVINIEKKRIAIRPDPDPRTPLMCTNHRCTIAKHLTIWENPDG